MPDPDEPKLADPAWSTLDEPEWTAAVDRPRWEPRYRDGEIVDYVKAIPCPKCKHDTVVRWEKTAAEGLRPPDPAKPAFNAKCKCRLKHVDSPPTVKNGCGRHGWIRSPDQWEAGSNG